MFDEAIPLWYGANHNIKTRREKATLQFFKHKQTGLPFYLVEDREQDIHYIQQYDSDQAIGIGLRIEYSDINGGYRASGYAIEEKAGDCSTCQWYGKIIADGPYATDFHYLPEIPPSLREVIYKNDLWSLKAIRKESSVSEQAVEEQRQQEQALSHSAQCAEMSSLIDNIEDQISKLLPLH